MSLTNLFLDSDSADGEDDNEDCCEDDDASPEMGENCGPVIGKKRIKQIEEVSLQLRYLPLNIKGLIILAYHYTPSDDNNDDHSVPMHDVQYNWVVLLCCYYC